MSLFSMPISMSFGRHVVFKFCPNLKLPLHNVMQNAVTVKYLALIGSLWKYVASDWFIGFCYLPQNFLKNCYFTNFISLAFSNWFHSKWNQELFGMVISAFRDEQKPNGHVLTQVSFCFWNTKWWILVNRATFKKKAVERLLCRVNHVNMM